MREAQTDVEARVGQLSIWFAGTSLEQVADAAKWALEPNGRDIDSYRSDALSTSRKETFDKLWEAARGPAFEKLRRGHSIKELREMFASIVDAIENR